jgi:hypothetical protein
MSATDCDRFTSLADQQALGEALTDADVRFLREHRDECAFCNAESRAFEALANSLDDARELTQPFALRVQSSLRWRPFAVAALAASVLAGVLGLRALVPAQSPNAGLPSRATLVLSAGSVKVDGAPARLGAKLETGALLDVKSGRVCTGFEPGIRTCLFDMSSARIGVLGEHRTLKLLSGRVLARLEKQPQGKTFAVETAQVSVLAKGTLFAVESEPSGRTSLRLYEGSVRLRARDGREVLLQAPAEASVGVDIEAKQMTSSVSSADEELILLSRLGGSDANCRLDVSSVPPAARVSLDGTALGPAPIAALIAPGAVRLALETPGYAPLSERIILQKDALIRRDYELLALPAQTASLGTPSHASAEAPVDTPPRATPAELLTRARTARAAGHYLEAARLYRQLSQSYPRSDEARVALVSLGELSLSELSDPKAALHAFEGYLKQGGGLTQEARYGKIRALGRLGRTDDERAAIERFLLDYPKSVQAASLRARLEKR